MTPAAVTSLSDRAWENAIRPRTVKIVAATTRRRRLQRGAVSGALEAWLPSPLEGADAVRLEICRRLAAELDTGSTPPHAVPRIANALGALLAQIEADEPARAETLDVGALLREALA
jgi:hypothetical protein